MNKNTLIAFAPILFIACLQEPSDIKSGDEIRYEQLTKDLESKGCSSNLEGLKLFLKNYPASNRFDNIQMKLAQCYSSLGSDIASVDTYANVSTESSFYPEALLNIGAVKQQSVKNFSFSQSNTAYQKVRKLFPQTKEAYEATYQMAQNFYKSASAQSVLDTLAYDSARTYYNLTIENTYFSTRKEESTYKIGSLYYDEKKWDQAKTFYMKVVQHFPLGTYVDGAYYWYAKALLKNNEKCEAYKTLANFASKYPQSDRIYSVQAELNKLTSCDL
jgi:TolA-binding protein